MVSTLGLGTWTQFLMVAQRALDSWSHLPSLVTDDSLPNDGLALLSSWLMSPEVINRCGKIQDNAFHAKFSLSEVFSRCDSVIVSCLEGASFSPYSFLPHPTRQVKSCITDFRRLCCLYTVFCIVQNKLTSEVMGKQFAFSALWASFISIAKWSLINCLETAYAFQINVCQQLKRLLGLKDASRQLRINCMIAWRSCQL